MKISVCIPTFNQAGYLAKAVDSALAQTSSALCEVIVSDDASTDDTAQLMEKYEGDSRVRYFRQPVNLGISGNSTFALKQACGDLIVRLDSDDCLMPEYAEILEKEFLETAELGVGHVMVREVDENDNQRRMRTLRRARGFQSGEEALKDAHMGYKVAANICMFRRSALVECGFYREGMNFAEDWDLWARLAEAGWGNYYADEVLASYRVWSDSGGYREGRKVSELEGILGVFDLTLQPAYLKRNWDTRCLVETRKAIACAHARALTLIPQGSSDYARIVELLEKLGRSKGLAVRLNLIRFGMGSLLEFKSRVEIALRDKVKGILFRKQIS
ncbi:glycosyltransferase family 2 protein [Luteolibacter sp. AS25]|uniref:glycosyltransferase family 2 protein n=1 Tax=Luteolibacter sp. AS25 TaxID=3135776 RepID=UPI00398AD5A5